MPRLRRVASQGPGRGWYTRLSSNTKRDSVSTNAGSAPRVAAVSGGSSGIGRAVAEAFAALGWKVAVGARGADRVRQTAEAVQARGGAALGAVLDVTDPDSIEAFFGVAEAELGPVDVVVNCAAHARPGALHELSPEEIRDEIESGLVGSLLFARDGIRRMRERGIAGDLVFLSSTSARVPWPLHTPYAASKAGVEQAARCLALELEGTGIRSTVIRVGNTVGTSFAEDWQPEELEALAEWQRLGLLRHGGLLNPEQVAQSVVWAVGMPRGVQVDHVSVHPEAPV